MLRPFVLAVLVNIVLTSYAVAQETQTATATATAEASSGPEGSTASSSANATTRTTTTVTTTGSNNESGSNSSTPGQGSNNNTRTCESKNIGEYDDPYDCSSSLTPARVSIFKLTFIFYKYFLVNYPDVSMVGAPSSTWYFIALQALYSYDETLENILKFLRLPNKKQVRCIMKYINTFFQNDPEGVDYKYTSIIGTDINLYYTSKYEQDVIELLEGRARYYDFSNPKTAAEQVDMEISEKTDGEIPNTIPSEEVNKAFNERSQLTWFAGNHFWAQWQKPFDENNITKADYYISPDKVIQSPFVFQRGIYRYRKSSYFSATMVEIPFVGGIERYTCLLILPDTLSGLLRLVQNLIDNPDKFVEEYTSMDYECLDLFLPVYRNVSSINDGLEIMKEVEELDTLYNTDTAQFQNSCGEPVDRAITAHYQGVKVENNLSGGTANNEPSGESYTDNECSANTDNDSEVNNYSGVTSFEVRHEAIYLILNNRAPILCSTHRVTDEEYNTSV